MVKCEMWILVPNGVYFWAKIKGWKKNSLRFCSALIMRVKVNSCEGVYTSANRIWQIQFTPGTGRWSLTSGSRTRWLFFSTRRNLPIDNDTSRESQCEWKGGKKNKRKIIKMSSGAYKVINNKFTSRLEQSNKSNVISWHFYGISLSLSLSHGKYEMCKGYFLFFSFHFDTHSLPLKQVFSTLFSRPSLWKHEPPESVYFLVALVHSFSSSLNNNSRVARLANWQKLILLVTLFLFCNWRVATHTHTHWLKLPSLTFYFFRDSSSPETTVN